MTNGDLIRSMPDEALAYFITKLMAKEREAVIEQLSAKGILEDIHIIEIPTMAEAAHLHWLRQPAEEKE